MFLGVGLPAIIVGVIAWFYLSDSPAKTKWLNDDEKEWLTGELTAEAASKTGGHERHSVRAVFRNGRVWTLSFIYFGLVYGLYTLAFFLPTIISGFEAQFGVKFDYIQKGFITAIPYLPAAVALYLVTRHATKHGVKPGHIIIPALAGAVSIPLALYAGSPALTIAIITVTACAIFSALPNFWTVPTQFLTGAAAAAGIALINTMGNLAGFAARYITGWLEGPHRRLQDVHVRRGRVHARVRPADGGAEPPEAGRAGPRYGGPGRALTDTPRRERGSAVTALPSSPSAVHDQPVRTRPPPRNRDFSSAASSVAGDVLLSPHFRRYEGRYGRRFARPYGRPVIGLMGGQSTSHTRSYAASGCHSDRVGHTTGYVTPVRAGCEAARAEELPRTPIRRAAALAPSGGAAVGIPTAISPFRAGRCRREISGEVSGRWDAENPPR